MLSTYKAEWEEYKGKVLNKPYAPYDAHNFEAYLATRLSTAEYRIKKLSYCDDKCGDLCANDECICRCHAFKNIAVLERLNAS